MYELTFKALHGGVQAHAPGYCVPYDIAALYESMEVPIGNGLHPELGVVLVVVLVLKSKFDGPGKTNATKWN